MTDSKRKEIDISPRRTGKTQKMVDKFVKYWDKSTMATRPIIIVRNNDEKKDVIHMSLLFQEYGHDRYIVTCQQFEQTRRGAVKHPIAVFMNEYLFMHEYMKQKFSNEDFASFYRTLYRMDTNIFASSTPAKIYNKAYMMVINYINKYGPNDDFIDLILKTRDKNLLPEGDKQEYIKDAKSFLHHPNIVINSYYDIRVKHMDQSIIHMECLAKWCDD